VTRWECRVTIPFVLRCRRIDNRSTCLDLDTTVERRATACQHDDEYGEGSVRGGSEMGDDGLFD